MNYYKSNNKYNDNNQNILKKSITAGTRERLTSTIPQAVTTGGARRISIANPKVLLRNRSSSGWMERNLAANVVAFKVGHNIMYTYHNVKTKTLINYTSFLMRWGTYSRRKKKGRTIIWTNNVIRIPFPASFSQKATRAENRPLTFHTNIITIRVNKKSPKHSFIWSINSPMRQ